MVHRRSYANKELYRLQALYHTTLTERYTESNSAEEVRKLKYVRSQALKKYTEKVKLQFTQTNEACFGIILQMLDTLHQEYNSNKENL